MAQRYIILMQWIEQGIANFMDNSIKRAEAARNEAEKIGGKFTLCWTFGKYDGTGILEVRNDEAALRFGLKVGSLGNVRATTLKAFDEEEIASVIDKLR
jgi:uncharacterized protein with GYD domain